MGPQVLQPLLAGNDIHGELFVVLGIQLIHLVQHGDVLHQHHLVVLQHPDDLIHIDLCLGIAGLQGLQLVALLLEEAEQAALLLLILAKIFQLHHQVGQGLAHLAQVLGLDAVQGVFREGGNVLLGRGAVLEHHIGVGDVDLLGKVIHHFPLRLTEHGLVHLDGVDVPLLLALCLCDGSLLDGRLRRRVQGQGRSLRRGGSRGCGRIGLRSQSQLGGHIQIVAHSQFLLIVFALILV